MSGRPEVQVCEPAVGKPRPAAKTRLAIFATHPIQYQAPLWRRLALQPDLQVKVFYGTDMSVRGYRDESFGVSFKWDTPLLGGYEHEFLSTDPRIQRVHFREPGLNGIHSRLAAFAPDVVLLTAYRSLFHLGALSAARRLRAGVVMRHEASDAAEARSWWKGQVRDWLLRGLYARVDRFAFIGTEARQHLLRLGVSERRVGFSGYCVDSDFMARQVERWLPQRARLRTELGVRPRDVVLVFSGKLTAKKNPLLIITALALLPVGDRTGVHLVVAGDGELKAELERTGRRVLGDRLHLFGFLNQSEVGRAYAAADVLVLPSVKGAGETWGLVVNEAMQFGLPAIVSDGVGCRADLVVEGRNGFVFRSGDATGLARTIQSFRQLPGVERLAFAERARNQAAGFSLEAAAAGLARTIQAVAAQSTTHHVGHE